MGRNELSNRKLAKNQAELSRQISELKVTVDAQADMIRLLLARFTQDGKDPQSPENDGRGWTR